MTAPEAIGIGLGFLAIVAPEFRPKMPRALSYTIAGVGLAWLTYSGILAIQSHTGMKLSTGPLALILVGAACIAGGLFWHFSRIREPTPTPPVPQAQVQKGSLRYVTFIATVQRFKSSDQTTVKMEVELENPTQLLLRYLAKLSGEAMGKTSPNKQIEFEGIFVPGEKRHLIFDTIMDVPINKKVDATTPVLSGHMDYDVTYWTEDSPTSKRRTAKRVSFDLWRPFNPKPPKDGSKFQSTEIKQTVRFYNEVEE